MSPEMTTQQFARFIVVLDDLLKRRKDPSISKIRLNNALLLYMQQQSLDNYFPEIYWRISAEDYMAKQRDGFNLIDYRLNDPEVEAYEAWQGREKITVVQALNYCAEKSVKVSFTFSEDKSNWCVSLTGREDNRFNSGATLTTWSDDPLDAFFMGMYKASVIFSDGKWQTRKSSQRG